MARIFPVDQSTLPLPIKEAFAKHVAGYHARITNMKATLAYSLPAFEAYMQWYPLYLELEKIIGPKLSYQFAYAVSNGTDCPLCSTFFRKVIIDAGEDPQNLQLSDTDKQLLTFGSIIAKNHGHIADHIYNPVSARYSKKDLVTIIAFAGQMIATNVFNNVLETDIDDYLLEYLPPVKSIWKHA
ncbi:MAG: hypothetical protein ABWZ25_12930 [Chitinophagaceae bacterium]